MWLHGRVEIWHAAMWPRGLDHVANWPHAQEPRGRIAMWVNPTLLNGHVPYVHVANCCNF